MKPGLRRGQLITWKDERGFGFIRPVDGGIDIFLHISELKDASRRPIVGDTIYYCITEQDRKICASDAFIAGARRKPTSLAPPSKRKPGARIWPVYPFPIAEAAALSIVPVAAAGYFWTKTGSPLPVLLYGVMGLISFKLYATDKLRAEKGEWRISEKSLLLCDLAGGWIGGFIAQRRFNHKVSKGSYKVAFWLVVTVHYALWLGWLIS
ncbi:MAG: cold shock and DUF1294 domain-containing protein [Elainellaceae cyanobacterium]